MTHCDDASMTLIALAIGLQVSGGSCRASRRRTRGRDPSRGPQEPQLPVDWSKYLRRPPSPCPVVRPHAGV